MHADVVILIPVFDEADALERVLPELIKTLKRVNLSTRIIVIDDGSTDGSGEVARQYSVEVLEQPNLGKPYAVKHGITHAVNTRTKHLIIFDGDGQHDPASIPELLAMRYTYTIVRGSRFHPESPQHGTPWDRQLLNRVIREAVYLKTGIRTSDPQCGLMCMDPTIALWACTQPIWKEEWEIGLLLALGQSSEVATHDLVYEIPIAAKYVELPGKKQVAKYSPEYAMHRLEERLLRQLRVILEF